ncbi:MAG: hypothetical protein ACNYZG_05590 [Gammaproteobacteria bacterium]
MNKPDTTTETDLNQSEIQTRPADTNETPFFPVSEGKLITLYILSFGLYGIYWFQQNWKRQQPMMDKKIYPVWRAIFSIFFTHSLFKRINQQAVHLPQQHQFNANALATFFVAAIVVSNVIDRLSINTDMAGNMINSTLIITSIILFLCSAYPLAKVQATINRINNDMLGYLNHKYSVWNVVLIILGTVSWLMLAMGLLAESMGLAVPE